jgi:hypothetical protein
MLPVTKVAQATFALLASMTLLSCSSVEFEQTAERGSLMEYDEAKIPALYRGLWASPKDACFVTRDYGMQMQIGESAIGEMPVRRLWFYSDYPDIVVELDSPEGEADAPVRMFLQPSINEQKLRMRQSGEQQERTFFRCKMK